MKIKHLFLALTICLCSAISFGQQPIGRFCSVTISPKNGMTSKMTARLSLGQADSTAIPELLDPGMIKTINAMNDPVDVLNQLSELGWTMVAIFPLPHGEKLYFKKEITGTGREK